MGMLGALVASACNTLYYEQVVVKRMEAACVGAG